MSTVHRYRTYCLTENDWIYSYGVTEPILCSNDSGHTINSDSVQVVDTISGNSVSITNNYADTLESSRVVQLVPIIDLKSYHGVTSVNKTNTTGTGAVTCTVGTDSEIKLSISGTTDVAGLRSSRRGYYTAGMVSSVGIAIRIPTPLAVDNILKYGYFDDYNGYYFKITGSTLNVCILYDGVETTISSGDFNKFKLDGSESNGITLDMSSGNIFRIDFTWYGFGQVVFGVIQTDITNTQKFFPMHAYNTVSKTSCLNPCLPINVQLSSNGSALSRDVYVAGRQYSILGKVMENTIRNMYIHQGASSLNTNTNRLFSLKYKTDYKTCSVKIKKIYALANVEILLQVYKNATLTGNSFADNTQVNESCLQVDTSSSFSGGTVLKSFLLFPNTSRQIDIEDLDFYEDDTMTFTWKSSGITNSMDLSVEWDEQW